jgi:alpha 1,2-mannosyltransferase
MDGIYSELSLSGIARPDVKFFCDLDYDPFVFMEENKKVYGASSQMFPFSLFNE